MAVRKSGERWIVEFMFRGERVFVRLPKGQGKQQAQAIESKRRSQIFDAVDLGKLPDPLLSKVIEEWAKGKDAKAQSHVQAALKAIPAGARLSGIGGAADSVVAALQGREPGTINRRLSVLKAAAKWAFRQKWTKTNLSAEVHLLPEKAYIRRETHPDMARRLIQAAATPRDKALIAGSAYTGMRLSEVLKFDPRRDIQDGAIRVRDSKNGEDRLIPILPELEPHLSQFPMTAGWRNVYRGFLRARERAGLEIRYHDLRHMAATAMTNAGIDLRTVGDILGHKSLQTTRKYTHPSLEAKRRALQTITAKPRLTRSKGKAKK